MSVEKIERGDEAFCLVTGFKGVVVSESHYLQGQTRFEIQPPVDKDGKIPDSFMFDECSLQIIFKNKVRAAQEIDTSDIQLGDEVEDMVSGLRGVVTGKSVVLNGCTRISIQPKYEKEGKLPKPECFDIGRVKKITDKKVEQGQTQTGGPIERVQRF